MEQSEKKIYNLEERTCEFGKRVITFAKSIPKNTITNPLISQLVRSATSIGSNYCEADCAESKKDFEHKLGICSKEAKETKHWFKMITVATPELTEKAKVLENEAKELQLIFLAIIRKTKMK